MEINELIKLFDLDKTIAKPLFTRSNAVYEVLEGLEAYIKELSSGLGGDYNSPSEGVYIHKTATVAKTALICGPAIVCEGAEIRHGAYIRGAAIIGKGAIAGNSTEIKNAVFFDKAAAPHFSYVGDSILGAAAHLGAGVICSNLRLDRKNVALRLPGNRVETGMRKLGALIGDGAEIGCNSVLNPGTVIFPKVLIPPLSNVKGTVEKTDIDCGKEAAV